MMTMRVEGIVGVKDSKEVRKEGADDGREWGLDHWHREIYLQKSIVSLGVRLWHPQAQTGQVALRRPTSTCIE